MTVPDAAGDPRPPVAHDPALPLTGSLLDPARAAEVLHPAVALHGGRVAELRVTGVRYRRGRQLAVRYRADIDWGDRRSIETAVLLTQRKRLPEQAAVLEGPDGARVAAWLYPWDPYLPGLPSAAAPAAVRDLLASLGDDDGRIAIRPRVYRPTARAVLQVTGSASLYLKVVRPDEVRRLYELHRQVAERVPAPAVYGYAADQGILVFEARAGRELGQAIAAGRTVPSPAALFTLLDRLAELPIPEGDGSAPATAVTSYRDALLGIAPAHAQRVQEIAERSSAAPWHPDRVVHGDFYEAQVLVEGERVSAVLDLDRLRAGDAADDAATLIAHLDVAAWNSRHAGPRLRSYRQAVVAEAQRRVDHDVLLRRVAGVLLGLAAWPFRSQQPDWPDRTAALIDLAARALVEADEKVLTPPSSLPHLGVG